MTLNIPMIKPVLHYYDIAKGVVAFSTTRHGGVSKGQLATLNINPHRGDEPTAVATNLQAVATEIGVEADRMVRLHQIRDPLSDRNKRVLPIIKGSTSRKGRGERCRHYRLL